MNCILEEPMVAAMVGVSAPATRPSRVMIKGMVIM